MQSDIVSNQEEFIKNRVFEIAWAVFRCAGLIKQSALKAELENMAVDVVVHTEPEHLEQLEQLIRLAEAVGEISKTNALVLFREIDNFKEIIRQRNLAIRQEKENSSAIEKIFAKPPMVLFSENPDDSVHSAGSGQAKLTTSSSAILRQGFDGEFGRTAQDKLIRQSLPRVVRQENSAKEFGNPSANENNSAKNNSSAMVRQDSPQVVRQSSPQGVLKKVKELGKTTTKELLSFFPGVSERTVRFYLQGLCEQGLVSRVGTTGPGSYYVARN